MFGGDQPIAWTYAAAGLCEELRAIALLQQCAWPTSPAFCVTGRAMIEQALTAAICQRPAPQEGHRTAAAMKATGLASEAIRPFG
jgi:hypothetical protein